MALSQSKNKGPGDLDRAWEPGDTIPAPEATYSDGDSAWALWNEMNRQHERRFARTAPMSPVLAPEDMGWLPTQPAAGAPAVPAGAAEAQPLFTLDAAMLVARRNNRVCPRRERWDAFTALLAARKTLRGTRKPPAPATGAAWAVTSALAKRLCFREQIEWAERACALEAVMTFLLSMAEDDWLHMGED